VKILDLSEEVKEVTDSVKGSVNTASSLIETDDKTKWQVEVDEGSTWLKFKFKQPM
jgi:hypothetical protein